MTDGIAVGVAGVGDVQDAMAGATVMTEINEFERLGDLRGAGYDVAAVADGVPARTSGDGDAALASGPTVVPTSDLAADLAPYLACGPLTPRFQNGRDTPWQPIPHGGLMEVAVAVNGTPIHAVIDSGAQPFGKLARGGFGASSVGSPRCT